MTTNTYTSPFTGDVVQPTDVSFTPLEFSSNVTLAWPSYIPPNSNYVPASRIMNCVATTTGLDIALPPGGMGSVGTDILFVNKGEFDFTITDSSGDQSLVLAPGQAEYFYLISNATVEGTWNTFGYGAGTSAINAFELAGSGLTTLAGKLATSNLVVEVSAVPTLNEASRAITYVWTGGQTTFTLPNPTSLSSGWYTMIRNGGTGNLTINATSPATLNGAGSLSLNPSESGIVVFDSSSGKFYTVGYTSPSSVSFSSATYDVDSIVGDTLNLVSYAPIIQNYVALAGTRTTTLDVILPAITQIYVLSNNTSSSAYNITFQISGSSQPPITFAAGTTAVVLSDGSNLYILTQVGAGSYFANNGSASAPSFSFNNDTTTGMYLNSLYQLGLSANQQPMLLLDATNLSDLQVSTPATFNAALIGGGTF